MYFKCIAVDLKCIAMLFSLDFNNSTSSVICRLATIHQSKANHSCFFKNCKVSACSDFITAPQIESDKQAREGQVWSQNEEEAFKKSVSDKYDTEASPW